MSEKILAVNAGSSSIKFKLYLMPEEQLLITGSAENIGQNTSKISYETKNGRNIRVLPLKNHSDAISHIIDALMN
ncbi:acetate kinase, partial [Lactobacillus sp. XV13L]|nr:acetate kinase [Lactobacillus sp. XV13L]